MLNRVVSAFILTLVPALTSFTQTSVTVNFDVAGVIRNQTGAVVSGLRLLFTKQGQPTESWTDINGEFIAPLHYGDYELTTDSIPSSSFKAFLKISRNGLNPEFLELVVDSDHIGFNSSVYPKVVTSFLPKYPPAARAVRAHGKVVVSVKINGAGQVISGAVLSGHPLLKATSLQTVKKWTFMSSDDIGEREAQITFIYLLSNEEKLGIIRFSDPYFLVIIPPKTTIEY